MVLIDILSERSFEEEHIPDAINKPVYRTSFLDDIQALNESEITIYGYSDETEEVQDALFKLKDTGIKVHVLEGGLKAHKEAGKPTEMKSDVGPHLNGEYPFDMEKSRIEWTGRNIGNKHTGSIGIKSGSFIFENNKLTGGSIVLDMNDMKNFDIQDDSKHHLIEHLQSHDFFETATYPEAKLVITNVKHLDKVVSEPNVEITAEITIKDQTHPITFTAIQRDHQFSTHLEINRTKWNVKYGSEKFFARLGMHIIEEMIGLDILIQAKV